MYNIYNLQIQQTKESEQSPEEVPPRVPHSDFEVQIPYKLLSPRHGCFCEAAFLLLREFKGIIGGKKKTVKKKNLSSYFFYINI